MKCVVCVIISFCVLATINLGCKPKDNKSAKEDRSGLMLNVYFAIRIYADDHAGWLPQSKSGPYDALQKLYPIYCPSGQELAGLSGSIDSVKRALKNGEPLTDKLSSWVYVQGFNTNDDPHIAILWEAKRGIFPSGEKDPSGGHAVLFLNGDLKQIPDAGWVKFLNDQEQFRKSIFDKRTL